MMPVEGEETKTGMQKETFGSGTAAQSAAGKGCVCCFPARFFDSNTIPPPLFPYAGHKGGERAKEVSSFLCRLFLLCVYAHLLTFLNGSRS